MSIYGSFEFRIEIEVVAKPYEGREQVKKSYWYRKLAEALDQSVMRNGMT